MRVKNTLTNSAAGLIYFIATALMEIITRNIFLTHLGSTFLGLNSLCINIISMLSLVELGIGTAILYSLYAPLASGDEDKVTALIQLYAQIYRGIAAAVGVIGLVVMLFLDYFVKQEVSMGIAYAVLALYIANSVTSYLFSHKRTLLYADQKSYITSLTDTIFKISINLVQIYILIATENYILYVLCQFVLYFINNIVLNIIVNRKYPYILKAVQQPITRDEKSGIVKNVKALFMHKIGEFAIRSTDNMLIAYFFSLSIVGIYTNYYLVINTVSVIILQFFNAVTPSFGNMLAKEKEAKTYETFKVIHFFNFWIVSFATISLYNLLNPFIVLWVGEKYLIDDLTYLMIIISFYLTCMRYGITSVKNAAGIFYADRLAPLAESVIKLAASIILVKILGLPGIFIGTIISSMAVPNWIRPYLVYKQIFQEPIAKYLKEYLEYAVITSLMLIGISFAVGRLFIDYSILNFILNILFNVIVINVLYIIIFYKRAEFRQIKSIIVKVIKRGD